MAYADFEKLIDDMIKKFKIPLAPKSPAHTKNRLRRYVRWELYRKLKKFKREEGDYDA